MYTVSDFVIDPLIEWNLHRFYGFPGDGIVGFDGAFGRIASSTYDIVGLPPVRVVTDSS